MQFRAVLIVALGAVVSSSVLAGQLAPPAGPVAETGRFGVRVEISQDTTPGDAIATFVIDTPGSYYLPGEVLGEAGKHGIEIRSSDVSIDLMGFTVRGVPGSLLGIRTGGPHENLSIVNGVVTQWGGTGIDLGHVGFGEGSRLERIHASMNGGAGMRSNADGVIWGCTAMSNAGTGIVGLNSASIVSCTAKFNGGAGISGSLVVAHCTSSQNGGFGFIVASGEPSPAARASGTRQAASSRQTAARSRTAPSTRASRTGYRCGASATSRATRAIATASWRSVLVFSPRRATIASTATRSRATMSAWTSTTPTTLSFGTAPTTNPVNYDIVPGNSYGPIINVAGVGDISAVPGAEHPWANFEH